MKWVLAQIWNEIKDTFKYTIAELFQKIRFKTGKKSSLLTFIQSFIFISTTDQIMKIAAAETQSVRFRTIQPLTQLIQGQINPVGKQSTPFLQKHNLWCHQIQTDGVFRRSILNTILVFQSCVQPGRPRKPGSAITAMIIVSNIYSWDKGYVATCSFQVTGHFSTQNRGRGDILPQESESSMLDIKPTIFQLAVQNSINDIIWAVKH